MKLKALLKKYFFKKIYKVDIYNAKYLLQAGKILNCWKRFQKT